MDIPRITRFYRSILLIAVALILTWAMSIRLGTIPPVGHFFNPFAGFWQNMEAAGVPDLEITSEELQSGVVVRYDDRGVPHIFAENDYDLYFAQGFVTARDRLWQIDFQSRAAAGRISEIIGPQALDYDRAQRRLGMVYGAEANAEAMMDDPRTANMIQAYADGYNAWIDQLAPEDYPVEFKILDYEPEPFTPLHSGLLLMNMSQTLTSGTRAQAQTHARALLDEEIYRLLYPEELPWIDPIIPPDQAWDFKPVEPPSPEPGFVPQIIEELPLNAHNPGIGSNSWAVDGSKTESGYPLLSSDPHLGVNLPSIWYEVQLHTPEVNTYGVSLPAAPGVVIGFNEFYAWGITNAGSHTLDVYEIQFRDETRQEYLHDGVWKPVVRRPEEIRVRRGEPVIDTVLYTHHGPVTQPHDETIADDRFPNGHAVQWLAHQPGNVLLSVYKYNRGTSQEEFEEALRHFTNITQNFTYADRDGNISMGHIGRFPVRFEGQGAYISNGRDPAYDWNHFVPFEHLPRSFNPERGFVSSANQAPVTGDYPYYLGRFYADFSRGVRINTTLEEADRITPDFFENMLMDNLSLFAEKLLPFLLERLDPGQLSDAQESVTKQLRNWNYRFAPQSNSALFYKAWKERLLDHLWDPFFNAFNVYLRRPTTGTTIHLLLEEEHEVFPVDVNQAVRESFGETFTHFTQNYGDDPGQWQYGRHRDMRVGHIAMLDGFGRDHVPAGGTPEAINATGTTHAPSWRMVVELGPEIRARGHYPGGQSGNPGHPGYDVSIDDWTDGTFYDLHFWKSIEENPEHTASTLTLVPFTP